MLDNGSLSCGKVLQLRRERHDVLRVGPVAAPRRQGRASRHRTWPSDTVLVLDAKELDGPIRDWDDLSAAIDADGARTLARAYDDGLRKVLLLYRHRDFRGVLGLTLAVGKDDVVTVKSLNTAPDDLATRTIRAHPRAEELGSKRVAVVGVGAVGSVAADLLHRSGVGELMLIDGDLVVPGNTTRHLLDGDAVGLPKAHAVADALHKARPRFGTVQWRDEWLRTVADALTLLADYDVVVDATADSTATAMLTAAAGAGAGQLLSACVLADGYAIRVDRPPVRDGDQPLPPPQLPPPSSEVYETGCGSPISQTPPAAVWEAAALAVRYTVGLLLNPGAVTPGEQRILAEGQIGDCVSGQHPHHPARRRHDDRRRDSRPSTRDRRHPARLPHTKPHRGHPHRHGRGSAQQPARLPAAPPPSTGADGHRALRRAARGGIRRRMAHPSRRRRSEPDRPACSRGHRTPRPGTCRAHRPSRPSRGTGACPRPRRDPPRHLAGIRHQPRPDQRG